MYTIWPGVHSVPNPLFWLGCRFLCFLCFEDLEESIKKQEDEIINLKKVQKVEQVFFIKVKQMIFN